MSDRTDDERDVGDALVEENLVGEGAAEDSSVGANLLDGSVDENLAEDTTVEEVPAEAVPRGAVRVDATRPKRSAGRKFKVTARTKARQRALDVLFEADAKGLLRSGADLLDVLGERRGRTVAQDGLPAYAVELVEGVADHLTIIDEILAANSRDWSVNRMPAVDRNLLRLGVFEIVFLDDVEDGAAIEQAATLAAELSTDDSPKFVNALLQEVSRTKDAYRV